MSTPEYILRSSGYLKPRRPVPAGFRTKMFHGTGALSSSFPSALTTVEGAPVSAQVLVRWRSDPPGMFGDGALVATTVSSPSGEWEVTGLNPKLRYDVSARYAGENDALQSNVQPSDEPRFSGAVQVPVGVPLNVALPIIGGTGSVSVAHVSGAYPSGVSLVGNRLQGSWPTGATGSYPVTFDLTDDEGTYTRVLDIDLYLLPMKFVGGVPVLVVGDPMSTTFTASGGEGPYTYAVTSGTLPAGLSLNGSTGVLSGTPAVDGPYSFEITATDVRSDTVSRALMGDVVIAAKFWRILVSAADNNAYCVVSEIEFNGAQATGGTASSSSDYGGAWTAAGAFDGVKNTAAGWCSATGAGAPGSWIAYEYAAPHYVGSVAIYAGSPGNQVHAPRDFAIQSSDDGSTWVTEWSVSGQTGWSVYEERTFARP